MSQPPVLLVNGIWRAGTTYVWNRLRENAGWRCYYEPLHESLAVYEPRMNAEWQQGEVWRQLRHPALREGYFEEYPLSASGKGVPHFSERFSYERFFLGPEDDHPALETYFASLIEFAASNGQRSCLQPNRLFLRARWFAARFPCLHLYLSRSWWDLWESMRSFGNNYFPSRYYVIAALNPEVPIVRATLGDSRLQPPATLTHAGEEPALASWIRNPDQAFRMFYAMYLMATIENVGTADYVVDMSCGSSTLPLWDRFRAGMAREGISSDFSDCSIPSYARGEEYGRFAAIAADVEFRIFAEFPELRIPAKRIPVELPANGELRQLLERFRA